MAFVREDDANRLLVILNATDEPAKISVPVDGEWRQIFGVSSGLPKTASCLESLGRSTFTPSPNHAAPDPSTFGERTAGVLLHPTSLPAARGTTGLAIWDPRHDGSATGCIELGSSGGMMLPIGPVALGTLPTARFQALIEPMLASMADLVSDGWLPASVLRQSAGQKKSEHRDRSSWSRARSHKLLCWNRPSTVSSKPARNRQILGEVPTLQETPIPLAPSLDRFCRPSIILEDIKHSAQREYHAFVQWILDRQWQALRKYAGSLDIKLIGDLPIFVEPTRRCEGQPRTVPIGPFRSTPSAHWLPTRSVCCERPTLEASPLPVGRPPQRQLRWWTKRVKATLDRFDLVRSTTSSALFEPTKSQETPKTLARANGDELPANCSRNWQKKSDTFPSLQKISAR